MYVVSVGVSRVDNCMSCVCGECWCVWSGRLHVLCVYVVSVGVSGVDDCMSCVYVVSVRLEWKKCVVCRCPCLQWKM